MNLKLLSLIAHLLPVKIPLSVIPVDCHLSECPSQDWFLGRGSEMGRGRCWKNLVGSNLLLHFLLVSPAGIIPKKMHWSHKSLCITLGEIDLALKYILCSSLMFLVSACTRSSQRQNIFESFHSFLRPYHALKEKFRIQIQFSSY